MWHTGIASNMNFPAPVAVLGLLAGVAGLGLSGLAAIALLLLRKMQWLHWLCGLAGVGAVVYFGLLFGFSLASHETTLVAGQEKYFCEIDCHLAYSVSGVREELPNGRRQVRIKLRTRFDETTISPRRPKDAPLTPNGREVRLIDGQGRSFAPVATAGTPLTRGLIPGDSYETELTFQVPADAKQLRLLLTDPSWDLHLLIGDENSLAHRKTYFAVPTA